MATKAENEDGVFQGKTIAQWRNQLEEKNECVRLSAAAALGECGPKAVAALTEELKNKDPLIRYWAAKGLGKIGLEAKSAIPALTEALKDPCESVRVSAAYTLWKLGKKTEAMAQFVETIKGELPGAQLAVLNDLCLIGPDAKEAYPAVREAAEKKLDDFVHGYVLRKASTVQKIFEGKPSFGE